MPGYQEYELYPGPDLDRAKQLIAEANPADRDITVWTDDEPDRKRIGEYYQDLLTQLGFNATLKVIAGDVYWTTIGNESTPDLDTGFADWFQDFPHPDDFFRPLLHGDSILPTNSNNFSRVNIPANNATADELLPQTTRRRRRRGAVRRSRPNALLSAVPIPDPKRNAARERLVLEGDVPSPIDPPPGCSFHPRCPFATDVCTTDEPALLEHAEEHAAACHHPLNVDTRVPN